jgi:RNA polymerase sigma-32 factor
MAMLTRRAAETSGNLTLSRYLHDIAGCKVLAVDEERRVATQYARTRAPALEARLVESCLRLVVSLASRMCTRQELLVDLIQEGNLGLLEAVRRFDPTRGLRLSTYATYWIRERIFAAVIANWRMVKVGTSTTQRRVFFRLRRERVRLERLGLAADNETLAQRFGLSRAEFERLVQHLDQPELSLDAPTLDGAGDPLGDLLPDSQHAPADVALAEHEQRQRVHAEVERCLARVTERERFILRSRWCSDRAPTLDRLGKRFGVSRERVRQIEKKHRAELARALAGTGE